MRRIVLREADDGLHQRHGLDERPASGAGHAAGGAIRSNEDACMNFIAASRGIDFQTETAAIRGDAVEARIEREPGTSGLRFTRKSSDKPGTLNDEVRPR